MDNNQVELDVNQILRTQASWMMRLALSDDFQACSFKSVEMSEAALISIVDDDPLDDPTGLTRRPGAA